MMLALSVDFFKHFPPKHGPLFASCHIISIHSGGPNAAGNFFWVDLIKAHKRGRRRQKYKKKTGRQKCIINGRQFWLGGLLKGTTSMNKEEMVSGLQHIGTYIIDLFHNNWNQGKNHRAGGGG